MLKKYEEGMDWVGPAEVSDNWWPVVNTAMKLRYAQNVGAFLDQLRKCQLLTKNSPALYWLVGWLMCFFVCRSVGWQLIQIIQLSQTTVIILTVLTFSHSRRHVNHGGHDKMCNLRHEINKADYFRNIATDMSGRGLMLFLWSSHFSVASAVLRYVCLRPFLRLSPLKYWKFRTFIIPCDLCSGNNKTPAFLPTVWFSARSTLKFISLCT